MRYLPSVLLVAMGCSSVVLDSSTTVDSVRILTTRVDQSSPAPGDTVILDALTYDGRADTKTRPMRFFWFPDPCVDPALDGYYACYPAMRAKYPVGVDITAQLSAAPTYTLEIPADAIARHEGNRGIEPYGQVVVFSMACAGHIESLAPTTEQESVPFGCFDDNHVQLGPDDWVFAYATVFAFAKQKNQNPTIDGLTYRGQPVDIDAGITVDHCTDAKLDSCPTEDLDAIVPDSAQEPNPRNLSINGDVLKEQVYVSYYVSAGKLDSPSKLLFDPRNGRITTKTADQLYAPQQVGDYRLWAVIHDDRGGANWLEVPLHAR